MSLSVKQTVCQSPRRMSRPHITATKPGHTVNRSQDIIALLQLDYGLPDRAIATWCGVQRDHINKVKMGKRRPGPELEKSLDALLDECDRGRVTSALATCGVTLSHKKPYEWKAGRDTRKKPRSSPRLVPASPAIPPRQAHHTPAPVAPPPIPHVAAPAPAPFVAASSQSTPTHTLPTPAPAPAMPTLPEHTGWKLLKSFHPSCCYACLERKAGVRIYREVGYRLCLECAALYAPSTIPPPAPGNEPHASEALPATFGLSPAGTMENW